MALTSPLFKTADPEQKIPTSFRGMPLIIQWPAGTKREGIDDAGEHWEEETFCDYGYIPDTKAAGDGGRLDVLVGPNKEAPEVYIVEQLKDDGEFDEYKLMAGFDSLEEATQMYLRHHDESHLGSISEVPFDSLFDAVESNKIAKHPAPNDPISQFCDAYKQPWHAKVADDVRDTLTHELAKMGVRAVVSSRGKSFDSLQIKLLKRNEVKQYQSVLEIQQDIKDLAGVRVALYFPIDTDPVCELINKIFPQARPAKHFPADREPGEPEGYTATHFCVWVKSTLVEIQVASALMFAWSEVAHDLLYKPTKGPLTIIEQQILDDLLQLVNAGEVKVLELQRSLDARTLDKLEFELVSSWHHKAAKVRPLTAQYLPRFAQALEDVLGV